ncbi:MAG: bifunctional phosphoribosyl-AMP cyclohydrolase/phosphoribosyl-ATP diphosphatase HisIE [Bacteroidetes bacterium]|nr:bifunctional phosphoribosyl-AMP cyclohydrolase/phosphoribosyl-ATP diphosphatase HisIE [Bacteroidota bacterium]
MIISNSNEVFQADNTSLVPCIVQDAKSQTVLMLGYMNKAALDSTLSGKHVTFFSRSRNTLWTKGETSGNYLEWTEIRKDCDNDTLLIQAKPSGPVCHTGQWTCFNHSKNTRVLDVLEETIQRRKSNPDSGSYTASLIQEGVKRVAQKVGEEAVELVIEAGGNDKQKFLGEAADLMYHFLVLLASKDHKLEEVEQVLKERMK